MAWRSPGHGEWWLARVVDHRTQRWDAIELDMHAGTMVAIALAHSRGVVAARLTDLQHGPEVVAWYVAWEMHAATPHRSIHDLP